MYSWDCSHSSSTAQGNMADTERILSVDGRMQDGRQVDI